MKKLIALLLLVVMIPCVVGCPFSPNVDQIRADFCAEYPEVCQYVDFESN